MQENVNSKIISQIMGRLNKFKDSGVGLDDNERKEYEKLRNKLLGRDSQSQDKDTADQEQEKQAEITDSPEDAVEFLKTYFNYDAFRNNLAKAIAKHIQNSTKKALSSEKAGQLLRPQPMNGGTARVGDIYLDVSELVDDKMQDLVAKAFPQNPQQFLKTLKEALAVEIVKSVNNACNDFSKPMLNKPVIHIRIVK